MLSSHTAIRIPLIACLIVFSFCLVANSSPYPQPLSLSNSIYLPLVDHQFDPAWSWQAAQAFELTPIPNTGDPMLMSIDLAGQPHLLYDTFFEPRYIYHTYPTSQGWITPTQIANTLGTSYTLFPPVRDEQGGLHLLWRNWLGSGVTNPYRLMYSKLVNGAWSEEEELSRFGSEMQGMLRPDQAGALHVTAASTLLFTDVFHYTRLSSGWSPPADISVSHPASWIWPDYLGGVHFYGEISYPQPEVVYSYWRDGEYHIEGQRTPGELPFGDSLLDGQNNLHLFRHGQVPVPGRIVFGVYHRCLTRDLAWTEEQVLSGQQDTLGPVVKAEDGRSQTVLAWQESAENMVQIRVFEGCKLAHSSSITLPLEDAWELASAAISQDPGLFCLLAHRSYTFADFLVQCAQLIP
jgi:hypothetical protein